MRIPTNAARRLHLRLERCAEARKLEEHAWHAYMDPTRDPSWLSTEETRAKVARAGELYEKAKIERASADSAAVRDLAEAFDVRIDCVTSSAPVKP